MRIDILTIFPEMFDGVLNTSILSRAAKSDILDFHVHNIRDYSENKHKNTDDYPFGGGAGMVMMAQPIFSCMESIPDMPSAHRVLLSPRGRRLDPSIARELSLLPHLILLCGHYEGIDERAMAEMDMELSVGDYVLTGGELPAMVTIDCLSRFIPGVLGSAESAEDESFSDGLLEYPQYTRPAEFRGRETPEVLLNGNHALIARWRREQSLKATFENRPELIDPSKLDKKDRQYIESLKNADK